MLHKFINRKPRDNRGFTIIEVLIVLAIAGLIMLIVFLAVPALQRNARNTQRKNDVASLLGAVTEYENNNGGSLPATVTQAGNTVTVGGSTPAQVGFYNTANAVSLKAYAAGMALPTSDQVFLVTGAICNGNSPAAGSGRSVIALYAVEPGSTAQCQGS